MKHEKTVFRPHIVLTIEGRLLLLFLITVSLFATFMTLKFAITEKTVLFYFGSVFS